MRCYNSPHVNSHLIVVEEFEYLCDPGCCVVAAKRERSDKSQFSTIDSDDNAGEPCLEEGDWDTLLELGLG